MNIKLKILVFLFLSLSACRNKDNFSGNNQQEPEKGKQNKKDNAVSVEKNKNDIFLNCDDREWKKQFSDPIGYLILPNNCLKSYTEKPTSNQNRKLDLVFILDISGSMEEERQGIIFAVEELNRTLVSEGWKVRAGAIGFNNTIKNTNPINSDLFGLSQTIGTWQAAGGTSVEEVGLSAIEKGVSLLQEADPQKQITEKSILYVSDAPARRIEAHGFDLTHTADIIKKYNQSLESASATLGFFYSCPIPGGPGWDDKITDDYPKPVEQIQSLTSAAGISSISLPFPLNKDNIKMNFVDKLLKGAMKSEKCTIKAVQIKKSDNTVVFSSGEITADNSKDSWNTVFPTLPGGSYTVVTDRQCSSGPTQDKINISI